MPIPLSHAKLRATAPQDIRAEDLSLKIIVLSQVSRILFIASTAFSSEDYARNNLLNLKNSIAFLSEVLDGADFKKKQENRRTGKIRKRGEQVNKRNRWKHYQPKQIRLPVPKVVTIPYSKTKDIRSAAATQR